ncbi:MAG: preprotein translocase subunit SecE [Bacilli bacterium]|nr:preprotein translocase subunit SecE [Bacilli bacterium]
MSKIKNYFIGVFKEGKKVRWAKGEEFAKSVATVFGYAIFFGLFLVIVDYLIINILKVIQFA